MGAENLTPRRDSIPKLSSPQRATLSTTLSQPIHNIKTRENQELQRSKCQSILKRKKKLASEFSTV
jgi:hypothetical protein